MPQFLRCFRKNRGKIWLFQKMPLTLHPKTKRRSVFTPRLGYGVMVTQQILVLSFLVRVRVPQQLKSGKLHNGLPLFCGVELSFSQVEPK